MSLDERIRFCRMLELMEAYPEFAKEIGVSDASHFIENLRIDDKNKDYG